MTLDPEPFSQASIYGDPCDAWYFIDRRGEGIPPEEREFFLCWYSAREDIVMIYRGHDLYGTGYDGTEQEEE